MFWRYLNRPKLYSSLNSVLLRRIHVCSPVYGLKINFHINCKKSVFNSSVWCKRNLIFRSFHDDKQPKSDRTVHKSTVYYASALLIVTLGCTYAAVPLYRIFCQAFSYGGTTAEADRSVDISKMEKNKKRELRIVFNADVNASLNWNFKPQQSQMKLYPGETALAFYTAENRLERPVIGVSTYNVVPFDAGQYFNKIQCFCFEEQMLNPHEQVDMPVFFYIDPEFAEDPKMELVDEIILSYTFFEVKEGVELPKPSYYAPHRK